MEQTAKDNQISVLERKLNSLVQRLSDLERRLSILERSIENLRHSSRPPETGQTYLSRVISKARRDYEREHR